MNVSVSAPLPRKKGITQHSSWHRMKAGLPAWVAAAAIAGLLSQPSIASESGKNWYFSVAGGLSRITDEANFTNGTTRVETDFDSGYSLSAAFGRSLPEWSLGTLVPRAEIEVSSSENEVDTVDFSGNGPGTELVASGSEVSAYSIIGSLYFDAPNILGKYVTPYVGGGVGVAFTDLDIRYGGANVNLNDDDTVLTWHVTGGFNFKISEQTSLFTDVGYREMVDVSSVRRAGQNPVVGAGGGTFEDTLSSLGVRAGLQIRF